jgi:type IV pilus assembly protein PilA
MLPQESRCIGVAQLPIYLVVQRGANKDGNVGPEGNTRGKDMRPIIRKRRRRGFTLVEMLVVVLIISVLMNMALPLYLSTLSDAAKKTCRANMQTICNAAQAWKSKNRAITFSALTFSALNADLGATPACPNGGVYTVTFSGTMLDSNGNTQTIPTNGLGVSCSYAGHNGYIPGIMGQ